MSDNNLYNPFKSPEFPFAIGHVENHIVFSFFYRSISLSYTFAALLLFVFVFGAAQTDANLSTYFFNNTQEIVTFLGCIFILSRLSYPQQAMVGWAILKFTMLIAAGLLATVGFISSYSRDKSDAFPNLFLGLLWLPSIEFIPKLLPYQRHISIARIALTIPCVYFGINSGHWHW